MKFRANRPGRVCPGGRSSRSVIFDVPLVGVESKSHPVGDSRRPAVGRKRIEKVGLERSFSSRLESSRRRRLG